MVAQTSVRFVCLLLLSTRKVAEKLLIGSDLDKSFACPKESTQLFKGFVGI